MNVQRLKKELSRSIPICPLCDNNHVDVEVCDHQAVHHVCPCVDVGVKTVIKTIITKHGRSNG